MNGRIIQYAKLTSVICNVHVTHVTCMWNDTPLCITCVTSVSHMIDAYIHVCVTYVCNFVLEPGYKTLRKYFYLQ